MAVNKQYTLKAILFDMDGTLADTEEIHRQAFNAAFNEFDVPCQWDRKLYKRLLSISGGRERIKQYLSENNLVPGHAGSALELAARIHRTKSEIYRQKLVDGHVGPRPGIKRLIEEAGENNIAMAIATSSSRRNVETLLKSTLGNKALELFETIVTCDIVEKKKPSPAVYNHVLKELGLYADECIALEDTLNGNMSALAAGIPTIITTHRFTTDDFFDGASLVINYLGEPGTPMTVQAGQSFGAEFVDLKLLNRIRETCSQTHTYIDSAAVAAE